jgi:hypothetical protein
MPMLGSGLAFTETAAGSSARSASCERTTSTAPEPVSSSTNCKLPPHRATPPPATGAQTLREDAGLPPSSPSLPTYTPKLHRPAGISDTATL